MSDHISKEVTPEVGEGPYYKTGSPQRNNVIGKGTNGEKLTVTGHVLDTLGNPVNGAWLDFWQADGNGEYDNIGYNLRGHQFTDITGTYRLETVIPAMYGTRTPHIHVKLRATSLTLIVTSQLFFPDQARNKTDPIFNPKLVMAVTGSPGNTQASFDFVLNI